MNLKGIDGPTAEYIQGFFDKIVETHRLDIAETFLVRHSIMRILCNQFRVEGAKLPADWRDPTPRDFEVTHVVDWLVADLNATAPWLERTDGQGRPRKLLKCSTIADLMHEADKAMDRRNGGRARKALGPEDEERIAVLGGGYFLVGLLTPAALDLESDRLHHCLGDGAYDGLLAAGWGRYLSVRDRKNRPVATIELRQEPNGKWRLNQIAGKHNGRPSREVMDVIRTYAVEQDWWDRHYWWPVVDSPDGIEYDVDRIPAGATIQSLDISQATLETVDRFELPAALTVLGDASLIDGIDIPERMTVCGILSLGDPYMQVRKAFVLPESLHVDREVRIWSRDDIVQPVPTHLHHRIRVALRKLTGHSWSDLEWADESHPLDEGDDLAPRP